MPREPKKPDEYIVHLMIETGHVVDLRFNTIEEVKSYAAKIKAKSEDEELLAMPMKNENELLLVRPKRISAIHAEPVFSSSVEMF
jgi:hypothetical protein